MSGDIERFRKYLEKHNSDYYLVSQIGSQAAHLRFIGRFQGSEVVWDCHFRTLVDAKAARNFIEVGNPGERGWPIEIGLSIGGIDKPAIEKMIIMIRNYKRLRKGRHEYG